MERGGEILIYESFTETTLSSASAYGQGKTEENSNVTYGYNSIYGNSKTRTSAQVKSYGVSKTFTSKEYRNIYIDPNGVVYNYQTNFGGLYDSDRCLDKGKTWLVSVLYLWPLAPLVAVPVISKAKKKGKVCK